MSTDGADGSGADVDPARALAFMTDSVAEPPMAVLYDPDAPERAWIRAPREQFLEHPERTR